jgi:hypothetical protein
MLRDYSFFPAPQFLMLSIDATLGKQVFNVTQLSGNR